MDKAPDAFRTISEVADELDVPQHVLRFWESRFSQIRPMKRAGGRRYYRADDVDLLRGIRQLLYSEGYTIRGVQRILKEQGINFVQTVWQEGAPRPARSRDDDLVDDAAELDAEELANGGGLHGLLPPLPSREGKRQEPRIGDIAKPDIDESEAAELRSDDMRRLKAVLHELGECRRLLDGALR